jgi:hypothetical protein
LGLPFYAIFGYASVSQTKSVNSHVLVCLLVQVQWPAGYTDFMHIIARFPDGESSRSKSVVKKKQEYAACQQLREWSAAVFHMDQPIRPELA